MQRISTVLPVEILGRNSNGKQCITQTPHLLSSPSSSGMTVHGCRGRSSGCVDPTPPPGSLPGSLPHTRCHIPGPLGRAAVLQSLVFRGREGVHLSKVCWAGDVAPPFRHAGLPTHPCNGAFLGACECVGACECGTLCSDARMKRLWHPQCLAAYLHQASIGRATLQMLPVFNEQNSPVEM